MAKMKSELSVKNQYYIPKHRYYELRHFCLQYPEWRAARNAVGCISSADISGVSVKQNCSDPVARAAEMRLFYENRMNMIDRIAKEADPSLYSYIFKGVTEHMYGEAMDIRIRGVSSEALYRFIISQPGVRYAYKINDTNVHFDIPKGSR